MTIGSKLAITIGAIALAACSTPPPADTGDTSNPTDAVVVPTDAPTNACVSTIPGPGSNFCSMPGCSVRDFTLQACDGQGTPYHFYGDDYCAARATVVIISAGWCVPCMMEAPMIERYITEVYGPRGVRVITVYAQDPNASMPTNPNCVHWQNQFGITAHMVMDQNGETQVYTPANAFPSNMVIDQHGAIYDVQYGLQPMATDIASDLDSILASQGQ